MNMVEWVVESILMTSFKCFSHKVGWAAVTAMAMVEVEQLTHLDEKIDHHKLKMS